MNNKFWDRVLECKHENLSPDYYEYVSCGTPYCGGSEVHCLDCGVYMVECGCGCNNGMGGWPYKRHLRQQRKKLSMEKGR